MNLADVLFASAARHGERVAVTDIRSGRSLTYGELARASEGVATFLRSEGVEPGQRIGLLGANSREYLPAAFGLLSTGACLVPLATTLAPAEMAQVLAEVNVNGCLAAPGAGALPSPGRRRPLTDGACAGFTFEWVDRLGEGPAEDPHNQRFLAVDRRNRIS